MDGKITIAVMAGTTRQKRLSIKAAKYVAERGRTLPNVEIICIDPADFSFPHDGDDQETRDPHYTDITARVDAFFIVTPEYNHSYPSSLKRMLDSEYHNYYRKPVAFAGVSNGDWGGTRAVEALLPVARTLGLVPIMRTVYFPRVQDIFDETGNILPEHKDKYEERIAGAFEELLWFTRTLKWGRTNVN